MVNSAKEKLKILTEKYAVSLPEKAQEIELLWKNLQLQPNTENLNTLIRLVHTLKGTAGTYGYVIVSQLADELEKNFRLMEQHEGSEKIVNVINSLIFDLKQIVLNPPEEVIENFLDLNIADKKLVRLIYILEKNNSLKKQYKQWTQFNYKVTIFDDVDLFINTVNIERPDMVIIDIEFVEKITSALINKFKEQMTLIVYAGKDNLTSRLQTVRHGGQAFLVQPLDRNISLSIIDSLFSALQQHEKRILIVDDSEYLLEYYAMVLESAGMRVAKVSDPRYFLSTLQEFQPDIILMDINMPYCTGLELAQIVHQQEDLSGIPITFLSSIADRSMQLELLSYAGDDFLTKPISPKHLIAAVSNRLMRSRLLRSRMVRDSLTKLYNHTMIHHQLDRELLIAKKYNREVCIILFDIDHFKSINDLYGHQAGDKILIELSSFLQLNLRKIDLLGRYGGEEFLIVLPNTSEKIGFMLAEDLRIKFAKMPHQIEDKELFVHLSGGVASYPAFTTVQEIVKAADNALLKAKETGRNKVLIEKNIK